ENDSGCHENRDRQELAGRQNTGNHETPDCVSPEYLDDAPDDRISDEIAEDYLSVELPVLIDVKQSGKERSQSDSRVNLRRMKRNATHVAVHEIRIKLDPPGHGRRFAVTA